jgi:formamidopyrimidine-DNA glycosylase
MGSRIEGKKISGVSRRAKRIVVELEGGLRFVVSLRMTGQLYFEAKAAPPSSFTRFVLQLEKGALRFDDARKFGRVWLWDDKEWAAESAKLGPEPLSMSDDEFAALLRRKKGMLKPLLMDQKTLSGVGNIYADEALWYAKLHPRRRAETLRPAELKALHEGIVRSLEAGIANRGTSIDDYVGGTGEKGDNQNFLHAYGRTGKPCERCGEPIRKIVSGQRGTHFCPRCQPTPRAKRPKKAT